MVDNEDWEVLSVASRDDEEFDYDDDINDEEVSFEEWYWD